MTRWQDEISQKRGARGRTNPCLPASSSVIPHLFRLTTWRITRVREASCWTADNNSYAAVARALQ
jgi:hypothetical protein